jgi:hypothetical protein
MFRVQKRTPMVHSIPLWRCVGQGDGGASSPVLSMEPETAVHEICANGSCLLDEGSVTESFLSLLHSLVRGWVTRARASCSSQHEAGAFLPRERGRVRPKIIPRGNKGENQTLCWPVGLRGPYMAGRSACPYDGYSYGRRGGSHWLGRGGERRLRESYPHLRLPWGWIIP